MHLKIKNVCFVLTIFVVLVTKILILEPMAEISFKANLLKMSP